GRRRRPAAPHPGRLFLFNADEASAGPATAAHHPSGQGPPFCCQDERSADVLGLNALSPTGARPPVHLSVPAPPSTPPGLLPCIAHDCSCAPSPPSPPPRSSPAAPPPPRVATAPASAPASNPSVNRPSKSVTPSATSSPPNSD